MVVFENDILKSVFGFLPGFYRPSQAVKILDGQTESEEIDLGNMSLASINIPAGFEGSTLQFKGSHDGQNYSDLYSPVTNERVTITVTAGRGYPILSQDLKGYRYLKLVAASQTGDVDVSIGVLP